jgi:hypothetical protein
MLNVTTFPKHPCNTLEHATHSRLFLDEQFIKQTQIGIHEFKNICCCFMTFSTLYGLCLVFVER